MSLRKDFNLSREGNELVYKCPDLKTIFDNITTCDQYVTIKASIPQVGATDDLTVEIQWIFTSNSISCGKLEAYKLFFGKDLEVKIDCCGNLILEAFESSGIKARVIIDPDVSITTVIPKIIYLFSRSEIESIISESIRDIQNRMSELNNK